MDSFAFVSFVYSGSSILSFFLGEYDDAISITIAIIIVVIVAFVQEYRSEQSLALLKNLVPRIAHTIRYNNETTNTYEEITIPLEGELFSYQLS